MTPIEWVTLYLLAGAVLAGVCMQLAPGGWSLFTCGVFVLTWPLHVGLVLGVWLARRVFYDRR